MTRRFTFALAAFSTLLLSGCEQIVDPKDFNDLKTQVAGLKSRCELLEKRIVTLEKAKKSDESGGSSSSDTSDDSSSEKKDKDKDKDKDKEKEDGGSSGSSNE